MLRILCAAMIIAAPAVADDTSTGDLTIMDPVIYKAFPSARTAAGYVSIENGGSSDDTLVGIRTDGFMAMLHESRESDGVASMIHLDAVEVPGGSTLEFAPGGFHIMIMGLAPDDLLAGDTLDAMLIFERHGEVPVSFRVEAMPKDGEVRN